MSEATKAAALAQAVIFHKGDGGSMSDVISTAVAFDSFLAGAEAPATAKAAAAVKALTTPAKAAPAAVPSKAATPAKKPAAKPAPEPEAEAEEEDAAEAVEGDVTKGDVAAAVESLLNADMRDKAKELFAKYKAKSLSALPESSYAAFVNDANDLLLSA